MSKEISYKSLYNYLLSFVMFEYMAEELPQSPFLRVMEDGVLEGKSDLCKKIFSFNDDEFHPLNLPVEASSYYSEDDEHIAVVGTDQLVYIISKGKSWISLPPLDSPITYLETCGFITVSTATDTFEWNFDGEWDVIDVPTPIKYICSMGLSTIALTMCGKVYVKGTYIGHHYGLPQRIYAKEYLYSPIPGEERIAELCYRARRYGSIITQAVTFSGVIWEAGETAEEDEAYTLEQQEGYKYGHGHNGWYRA